MNIIQFDSTISLEILQETFLQIKKEHPDIECIAVPKGISFIADIDAEALFQIADNIAVALEKIKEERPEEYQQAYNNRMVIRRDEQWRKVIKKAEEIRKKEINI